MTPAFGVSCLPFAVCRLPFGAAASEQAAYAAAHAAASPAAVEDKRTYNSLASRDNSIDSTSVDIKGNGYSRPNRRKVTSPGMRPMPIFLSHGQQADNTATATNVVNSQRIIASSSASG
jgi:hypothetical protein